MVLIFGLNMETLFKFVPIRDIRRVYKKIEKSILEGKLSNNEYSIERYIRDREYDRF